MVRICNVAVHCLLLFFELLTYAMKRWLVVVLRLVYRSIQREMVYTGLNGSQLSLHVVVDNRRWNDHWIVMLHMNRCVENRLLQIDMGLVHFHVKLRSE